MQNKFKDYIEELQSLDMSNFPEVLERYSQAKFHIKKIDEFLEEMKYIILNEMESKNQREIPILDDEGEKLAGFYITERKSWEYPETVTKLETELKKEKKISELEGSAICTISKSLTYR